MGCILCLIVTLAPVDRVSGCRKPPGRSSAKQWIAPSNVVKCMRHFIDEFEALSGPCCDLGICPSKGTAERGLMRRPRQAMSLPGVIGLVIRCILQVVAQDKERYLTLNCCKYVEWPFWCSNR